MRHSLFALTAAVALGLAATAGAQTISFRISTGDGWVDNRLVEVNDYGVRYREPFVNEIVTSYGAPRPYVNELLVTRHWSPGDVYYACAMAHSIGRPCAEVADRYDHDRGHGWGAVAMSYGIKPGSPQFFALKRGVVGSYGHWGHPIAIDREERVRWEGRGEERHEHGHDDHDRDGHHRHDHDRDDHGHHGHDHDHDDHGHRGHDHDDHDHKDKEHGHGH